MRTISEALADFEALPEADIKDVLHGHKALMLATHPDDESLGCGGLIAAACEIGKPPIVVVMTDGAASHSESISFPAARLKALREPEASRAVSLLGLPPEHLLFLGYPDTRPPSYGPDFMAAVRRVELIAAEAGCTLLVAPWHGDPNCDHEATARIAAAATSGGRLELLSYPVWGSLRDGADSVSESRRGGLRLNISAYQTAKQLAIAAHISQYGGLIDDSPSGFHLPDDLLAICARPFEVFIT
jgi:LmbE family N-acetylglucosaminyl deacetylase